MINRTQLPELLGFLGTLLLILPAIRANSIAKRSARVSEIVLSTEDDRLLHELRDEIRTELNQKIGAWNRLDEMALFIGLGLICLSFVAKMLL